MTAPTSDRVCPLCNTHTGASDCGTCGVPTVVATLFAEKTGVVNTGTLIAGRYKVESVLGQGGMGAVYRANQLAVNRPVAIKTLLRDLVSDQKNVVRFYREAQAASQLDHPNIVRVFDFGIDDDTGAPFIVMEFLEGESLRDLVGREGGLTERRACSLLAQVTKALIQAHEKGLVHRDLKPDNIHVRRLPDGDEHCKVLDFGLAKVVSGAQSESQQSLTGGTVLGTPLYMSPEQIQQSGELDFRSDLYALGCILYQMLTGAAPFAGADHMAVIVKHINEEPPALPPTLTDGRAPTAGVVALYRALLAKDPKDRAASTVAASRALSALARGEAVDIPSLLFAGLPSVPAGPNRHTIDLGIKGTQPAEPTMHAGIEDSQPSKGSSGASVWLWAVILLLVGGGVAAMSLMGDETPPTLTGSPPATVSAAGGSNAPGKVLAEEVPGEAAPAETGAVAKLAEPKPATNAGTEKAEDKAVEGDSAKAGANTETADASPTAIAEPVAEVEPAAPKTQRLTSKPDAKLYRGNALVGTTPQTVELPAAGETLELTLRAEGFKDLVVSLSHTSAAEATVALVPVPAAKPEPPEAKTTRKVKKSKKRKQRKQEPASKTKKIQVW